MIGRCHGPEEPRLRGIHLSRSDHRKSCLELFAKLINHAWPMLPKQVRYLDEYLGFDSDQLGKNLR